MGSFKMIIAWLGGFVVMYLLSFVWYVLLMGNYYMEQYSEINLPTEEFSMPLIIVGYLILSFMMSYIYPLGYKGGPSLKEGLRFGIQIGILFSFPGAFILAAVYKMPLDANIVDALYHVVELAAGGVVIAMIYGSGGKSESPESSE